MFERRPRRCARSAALAVLCVVGCATAEQAPTSTDDTSSSGAAGSTGGKATAGSSAAGSTAAGGSSAGSQAAGTSGAGSTGLGGSGTAGASGAMATSGGMGGTAAGSAGSGTAGSGTAGSVASAGSAGSIASAGSAGSNGTGTVLFSDDFQDGNANGWTVAGGTWAVITDGTKVYAQQATGTGSTLQVSANGATSWTNQIVEARIKVLAFGGQSSSYFAAIYARFSGTDYYALTLRSDGKVAIRKGNSTLGSAVTAGIAPGTWYTVRFEVVGSTLKAYVNGALIDTQTDSSLTTGGIALSAVNTTAEFDDVKVTLP